MQHYISDLKQYFIKKFIVGNALKCWKNTLFYHTLFIYYRLITQIRATDQNLFLYETMYFTREITGTNCLKLKYKTVPI